MKKRVCIVSTLVFKKDIEIEKRNNLLSQLYMLLTFLKHYQDKIQVILVSNKKNEILNLLKKIKINSKNIQILEIKNEELIFCNSSKGEHFRYAFSKLDALPIINNYLKSNKQYKKLIISDIDSIFMNMKRILIFSKNIKTLAAINYRNEQSTNEKFDKMLTTCIKQSNPDFSNKEKLAWINSGFVIIDILILPSVIKISEIYFRWINENKSYVKRVSSNHYSDEIIFSAIFNKFKGTEINNNSSKIARFYWTCTCANKTFLLLNPFNYPGHIHIPATKYLGNHCQMSTITKLGNFKYLNFFIIIFLNYLRLKSEILNKIYLLKRR